MASRLIIFSGIAFKVNKILFLYVLIVRFISLFLRDVNRDLTAKNADMADILAINTLFLLYD